MLTANLWSQGLPTYHLLLNNQTACLSPAKTRKTSLQQITRRQSSSIRPLSGRRMEHLVQLSPLWLRDHLYSASQQLLDHHWRKEPPLNHQHQHSILHSCNVLKRTSTLLDNQPPPPCLTRPASKWHQATPPMFPSPETCRTPTSSKSHVQRTSLHQGQLILQPSHSSHQNRSKTSSLSTSTIQFRKVQFI